MVEDSKETIQKVIELIQNSSKHKFRKNEKINFAYKYWNITDKDIIDLYQYLAENKSKENARLARTLSLFIDDQDITNYRKFYNGLYHEDIAKIKQITSNIKTNGNWLSLYNEEIEFTPKSSHTSPTIYSYMLENDQILTIDRDKANKILGILMEANIPTAKCIVTASFPYYAHDNMDTYITSFQKIK